MSSVAIITDNVGCLPPEVISRYRIYAVPVRLVVDHRVYRDGIDITIPQAYQLLRDAHSATTSPPSATDFLEAFRHAAGAGVQGILCLTLSARLSSLYDVARQARELFTQEAPGMPVQVLDTGTAAGGEGLVVLAAARTGERGEDLKAMERAAQEVMPRVRVHLLMNTLRHLHRTGRIPRLAAQFGGMLPVKVLLAVSGGEVHFHSAVRTRRQGISKLLQFLKEGAGGKPVRVIVMHADCAQEGEELRQEVLRRFQCLELYLTEFTPVMGYATGPGVLGIAFHPED